MNKLFILIGLISSLNAVAASLPFGPSEEAAILALQSKQLPSSAKGLVRAVWDPSGNSDAGSSTTGASAGVHGLGVFLPAGALITDSYGYVVTPAVKSAPQATVAFQCEDANNILSAADISNLVAGDLFSGSARGMSSVAAGKVNSGAVAQIANGCEVSAKVATNAWSAGKVIMFVEYVLAQ